MKSVRPGWHIDRAASYIVRTDMESIQPQQSGPRQHHLVDKSGSWSSLMVELMSSLATRKKATSAIAIATTEHGTLAMGIGNMPAVADIVYLALLPTAA